MPEESNVDLTQLRQLLIASFNDDELRDLAFDLEVDYEALPGSGKKARELIEYFQRRANLAELLAACRQLRPNVAWPSLPEKPATTPPTSAPASSVRALHQLRPAVGDFVGRNDEIDRVVQALRQSVPHGATVLIWGMGGLGKTELAYAVADQLAADFPDAQLLLKLRGASDTPLSLERALQQIIHLNQALAIARQIEDRQGEALASWNLGMVHERQGDLARAAELMQVRVDYERAIGHLKAEERVALLAQLRAQLKID